MRNRIYEQFMASFHVSDAVPEDVLIMFQPGESWDVTKPDGSVERVEIKPATGAVITNIGRLL